MDKKVRWGILATGGIARVFAADLKLLDNAELMAVGSRSPENADKFAKDFDIPIHFGSYDELAACPEVDAVYLATPHPFHKENTLLCLNAGKAVLCEKPFAMNAIEAREMIAAARANHVFLMEAMWVRFTPLFQKVKQWLKDGLIGDVRYLQSDFGFRSDKGPESRVFNPALGGGSLLDVGVYPISFASFVFDKQPSVIKTCGYRGATGVDEQESLIFEYDSGQTSSIFSANTLETKKESIIFGSNGFIHIYGPWNQLKHVCITVDGKEIIEEFPVLGRGYTYQAIEVMDCLSKGKTESDILPLVETLAIMETMDTIRAQWNFKYPME